MSSYLRSMMALPLRQMRRSNWRALAVVVPSSPAALAKTAYLLAFAVVVSLLIVPGRSEGQFRGIPAVRPFGGFPFPTAFPIFGSNFTGIATPTLMTPTFPAFPFFPSMPGPQFMFPLNNFLTDSTGLWPFFAGFGFTGFSNISFGAFGSPFGFTGFSSVGFGNGGLGLGGFGGFNRNFGLNGFGLGGFGGGMGGFAGKGFGGFNGKNAL